MDKRKLNRVFAQVKENAKLDYAVATPDKYGDCNTCVNCGLAEAFGVESTGIYAKHWTSGMNKGCPWSKLDYVYIGHDVTEEQAVEIIRTFEEAGYDIEPKQYDPHKAFCIREK